VAEPSAVFAAFVAFCNAFPTSAPVSYHGKLLWGDTPYDGIALFKFVILDQTGAKTYSSNDGTSTRGEQPKGSISVRVAKGNYTLSLGRLSEAQLKTVEPVRLRVILVWFYVSKRGITRVIALEVLQTLRAKRIQHGISMNRLAKLAGLSQSMVSLLEHGKRNPTRHPLTYRERPQYRPRASHHGGIEQTSLMQCTLSTMNSPNSQNI
jgi:hypothetical protein